jgi:hypothetical protein
MQIYIYSYYNFVGVCLIFIPGCSLFLIIRKLLSEKLAQTCGINLIFLILSTMVSCKTGRILVMCGTMHFTMN